MSKTTCKIGRFFGIRLEIHYSFLLLLVFYAFLGLNLAGTRGMLSQAITIVLVFVSVTLHEYGHCLTARHYGIKVPRIVLMAIGGMAQLGSIPREPRKEMIITINGPLVNLALALIFFAVIAISHQSISYAADGIYRIFQSYFSENYVRTPYHAWTLHWESFVWALLVWNIVMGLFNLLPIFPMDGGRLLRAGLATRMSYLKATQTAVLLAKLLATAGIAWALWNHHVLLAILLTFIWVGGDEELKYVRALEGIRGKTVRDVMSPLPEKITNFQAPPLPADGLMEDRASEIFGWAGVLFPVYEGETLVGVVDTDTLWYAALGKEPPARLATPSLDKPPDRYAVLGVDVSALNLPLAVHYIIDAAEAGQKGYATFTGVHGVIACQNDEELRRIHNASLLTCPDGMPLVWQGQRLISPYVGRVYGPDMMLALCKATASTGHKHFFYGGAEGVAEVLAAKLQTRFPGLTVSGTYTPPFRPLNAAEEAALIAQIKTAQPDFFWVGISTPKQERFMAEWLPKLDTTVMLGVGAAFDFHSGRKAQAPLWMQRNGLEWLYRTITEPRRLAGRYLKNNTRYLWLILWEKMRRK